MRLVDLLIYSGWRPVSDDRWLWIDLKEPDDPPVTVFQAAAGIGLKLGHQWNSDTLSCNFCGVTQRRVFVEGESAVCSGEADPRAFSDRAEYEKLQDRIKRALDGEEGMLWDPKND